MKFFLLVTGAVWAALSLAGYLIVAVLLGGFMWVVSDTDIHLYDWYINHLPAITFWMFVVSAVAGLIASIFDQSVDYHAVKSDRLERELLQTQLELEKMKIELEREKQPRIRVRMLDGSTGTVAKEDFDPKRMQKL